MARSIGKVKIRKLEKLVDDTFNGYVRKYGYGFISMNYFQIQEEIKDKVPAEWYDIWESAWCEIERIIEDRLTEKRYAK